MSFATPVFGSITPDELVGEVGVPDLAVLIDDHVMRLRLFARQIVFRDDDVGGFAVRARLELEGVFGRVRIAERDAGEIGRGIHGLGGTDRRALAARAGKQRLRTGRRGARRIGAHPLEDVQVFFGGMGRGQHPLQRVAARAVDQELLLLVGARNAVEPFRVRQRADDVPRLAELDVGLGGLAGRDGRFLGSGEDVARGADRDVVLAGRQAVGREAEIALVVAGHRNGDGRAFLLGADQNAFHVAFLGRGHHAGQRGGALRERVGRQSCQQEATRTHTCKQPKISHSHRYLPRLVR